MSYGIMKRLDCSEVGKLKFKGVGI